MLAAAVVLFSSCGKEEDEDGGTLNYNNIDYTIKQGFLYDRGVISNTGGALYTQDILLVSDGITCDLTYGTLSGKGHKFKLELTTNQAGSPKAGTYTYNASSTHIANTVWYGNIYINYDETKDTYDYTTSISSGSVVVAKDGSTYTLTYNFNTTNGKTINGTYTGGLSYIDYTKK